MKNGIAISVQGLVPACRRSFSDRATVIETSTGIRLHARIPSAGPAPSSESACLHSNGCSCRRPYIGRALVIGVALELFMGLVAIATGATLIGVVACASMAGCMWLYAVAEIVAFYRVGLPEPEAIELGVVAGSRR